MTQAQYLSMERKRKLDISNEKPFNENMNGSESQMNPFTGKAYSQRYYDILAGREGEFLFRLQMVNFNTNGYVSCRIAGVAGERRCHWHARIASDNYPGGRDRFW